MAAQSLEVLLTYNIERAVYNSEECIVLATKFRQGIYDSMDRELVVL